MISSEQLSSEEDRLFSGHDDLFRDGAVNARLYCAAPSRIAFILKEPNVDPTEKPWPLRKFLADGAHSATWNNVARWSFGVLSGLPEWEEVRRVEHRMGGMGGSDFRKKWLSQIAVVNLNKRGGGTVTDPSKLREATTGAAQLLGQQIRILRPHLLVCGGDQVGDLLQQYIFSGDGKWERIGDGRTKSWVLRRQGADSLLPRVVSTWHPQARCSMESMYADLAAAVRASGHTNETAKIVSP